jgi:hypothetical protein
MYNYALLIFAGAIPSVLSLANMVTSYPYTLVISIMVQKQSHETIMQKMDD